MAHVDLPETKDLRDPDDFVEFGLQRLWSVMQALCDDGWDYRVSAYQKGRVIDISLRASMSKSETPPFAEWGRIISACDPSGKHGFKILCYVFNGGSGEQHRWMFTSDLA